MHYIQASLLDVELSPSKLSSRNETYPQLVRALAISHGRGLRGVVHPADVFTVRGDGSALKRALKNVVTGLAGFRLDSDGCVRVSVDPDGGAGGAGDAGAGGIGAYVLPLEHISVAVTRATVWAYMQSV